ncbi:hypothetical protein BaRGS_00023390 [Batillaria attramentaria]|uniref:AB hydrolase-1 domain-containing protein n=1 Tax=Batillaria attramentaria TaxID=370345 RepID=A0ABD0KEG7_9CAEN
MNTLIRVFVKTLKCGKSKCRTASRRISITRACSSQVNIAYRIYPHDSKPETAASAPIFVLHGLFGSKRNWNGLAQMIASSTDRIVVTMDARNHGDSGHSEVMNYPVMRDDLLGVMDRLKPERVSSLIVVDSAPKLSPGVESLVKYTQKMKELTLPSGVPFLQGRREVAKELRPIVRTEGELSFLLTNLTETKDGSLAWRVNLDAVLANLDDLGNFPEFTSPCNITTHFIGGSLSRHLE